MNKQKHKKTVSRILTALLLLVLTLATFSGIAEGVGWLRFNTILSGSMQPTLPLGSIAVLTSEPTSALQTGQIVAFYPPSQPNELVIHRVIKISHNSQGEVVISTKGDANSSADGWKAVVQSNHIYKEVFAVPLVGYLTSWLHNVVLRLTILVLIVVSLAWLVSSYIWNKPEPMLVTTKNKTSKQNSQEEDVE